MISFISDQRPQHDHTVTPLRQIKADAKRLFDAACRVDA